MSAFDDFVKDLDMDGVNGVSCAIIHPIIDEFLCNATPDTIQAELTDVQRQIRTCLTTESLPMLVSALEPLTGIDGEKIGFIATTDDIKAILGYAMTIAWVLGEYLEAKFQ